MGFKTLFASKSSAPSNNSGSQKAHRPEQSETFTTHKRLNSGGLLSGIRKALRAHHGKRDTQPYRFQSLIDSEQSEPEAPLPSLSSPTTVASGSSPVVAQQGSIDNTMSTTPSSLPASAHSALSPTACGDTSPTTPEPNTSKDGVDRLHGVEFHAEYESALEEMRGAAKILERRHAAIKTKVEREVPKKSITRILTKQKLRNPVGNSKKTLQGSIRDAKLPSHLLPSSYQQRHQAETAQDAVMRYSAARLYVTWLIKEQVVAK